MLEKFVNQVQSSTNPSLDSLKKLAGLDRKKQERDDKIVEPEFTEQDGLLEISSAKRMLKWHAEAIERTVEFTPYANLYILRLTCLIMLEQKTLKR
jgi:Exocyst complex component Sec10